MLDMRDGRLADMPIKEKGIEAQGFCGLAILPRSPVLAYPVIFVHIFIFHLRAGANAGTMDCLGATGRGVTYMQIALSGIEGE